MTGSFRGVTGTSIIGARGKTRLDQNKIDKAVVGPCKAEIFTKTECDEHREASLQRREELYRAVGGDGGL